MHDKTVLIIGEVFIDTHLDMTVDDGLLVRLGGIFHSARAYSAMNINYAMAYYAPDYLNDDIDRFACLLRAKGCYQLGSVMKAPNVMLINESKEICHQGYYNIIKDQAQYTEPRGLDLVIEKIKPTDVLIYPGRFNVVEILNLLRTYDLRIHIDFHYDSENIFNIDDLKITTAIISTSSSIFMETCKRNTNTLIEYFKPYNIEKLLVKENRGGAFCYSFIENKKFESPAYYVQTMHSVGVGDVYNSFFISHFFDEDIKKKMCVASLFAAKYAETMDYKEYECLLKTLNSDIEESLKQGYVRLSWEERENKNIYIAAPDFPNVNIVLLNKLADCLSYHNFKPRLPIRENGLVSDKKTKDEEYQIYKKDMVLLDECDLLIAVLLFNDPGTLVELGYFKKSGKPTIIYDPYNLCSNMFVRNTPTFLCKSIGEVIDSIYQCFKKESKHE